MPRQQRKLSNTGVYHIMLRGNGRKHIFADNEDKQCFLDYLAKKKNDLGFSLYAYCVMDNHVHLLMSVEVMDLSVIMKGIAIRYATHYNRKYNLIGHVFQDRFRSEPIECDNNLLAVVRYIHNNPLKAGMVQNIEDYEWSSYCDYVIRSRNDIGMVNTNFILGLLADDHIYALKEFIKFSNELDDTIFLDTKDQAEIETVEEGRICLEEYLMKRVLPGVDINIDTIRAEPQIRNEVIAYLKGNTQLSYRKIAQLLGVGKNLVGKIQ